MKLATLSLILALSQTIAAKPLIPRQSDRGSYEVPGLGARKQEILNAGGTTQDLGIAMLETYAFPIAPNCEPGRVD